MNFDNLSIHEGWNCFAMIGEHFDRLSQAKSITYDVSDRRKKNLKKCEEFFGSGYQPNWKLSKCLALILKIENPDRMLQLR